MNDYELNSAEINGGAGAMVLIDCEPVALSVSMSLIGSKQSYPQSSIQFNFSTTGNGQNAIIGAGSAQIVNVVSGSGKPAILGAGEIKSSFSVSGIAFKQSYPAAQVQSSINTTGYGQLAILGAGGSKFNLSSQGNGKPAILGSANASISLVVSGNGKPAILGSGITQFNLQSSMYPQVDIFLSGDVSFDISAAMPPSVRKKLESSVQSSLSANASAYKFKYLESGIQFSIDSVATPIAILNPSMNASISHQADLEAIYHRSVFGLSKPAYIETRTYIPEIKNNAIHLSSSTDINVFANLPLNTTQMLGGFSAFGFNVDCDARLGEFIQLDGGAEIHTKSRISVSIMNYIYLSGETNVKFSCAWGIDGKPIHNFGFISAKPDRLITVPMENRTMTISRGAM